MININIVTLQVWRISSFHPKIAMTFGCKLKTADTSFESFTIILGHVPTHFERIWWTPTHTKQRIFIGHICSKGFVLPFPVQPGSEITAVELGICLIANSSKKRCLERLGDAHPTKMVQDFCWYPTNLCKPVSLPKDQLPFPPVSRWKQTIF